MASLSGSTLGNAYQLSNIAANDVLPMEGQVAGISIPAYTQYAQWLNQITSSDPSLRTQAAAPAIAQTTAQTQQAENQISQLPRGGEQNYLKAAAVTGGAANVSNFLNQIYTQGKQQQGQLGSEGIAQSLTAISDIGSLDSAAAQIENAQQQLNSSQWQGVEAALTSIGEMAAGAAAGGAGGGSGAAADAAMAAAAA